MGVTLLLCAAAGFAAWRAGRQVAAAAPASMTAMLPQGALLTIESPDFAGLLAKWNASPEQKAWLASDDESVFSKSRLFGRLNDARTEFEAAARIAKTDNTSFNGDFLTQVAGRQSVFAWYDVGNLEFLYITRIDAAQAGNLALMKNKSAWTARQAGGTAFFIRKTSAAAAVTDSDEQMQAMQGKARTVAFAQVNDAGGTLLLLATREDLIANALVLHAAGAGDSVASEGWFTKASAALPAANRTGGGIGAGTALHMVLNLDRLVGTSYFRSYWVQRNVTAMGQYRAAVSDLYVEDRRFREERALLPNDAADQDEQADLGSLAALVPTDGVFQARATHDADVGVTAMEEKLLGHIELEKLPQTDAPDPELEAAQQGSATNDLEVRIDALQPVPAAVSNRALADALKAAGMDAVLTYSSARRPATQEGLWVPIRSVVALHAGSAWNAQALQAALQQSLRGSLTAAELGIEFRAETEGGRTIYGLTGPKPLWFAAAGDVCLLADDKEMLTAALARVGAGTTPQIATKLAGFNHTAQRAPFARLVGLIDGTNGGTNARRIENAQPAFFSGNMRSLSDAFAAVEGERFVERRDGAVVRQTVTYEWAR
jgi:hypothetical protein